MSLRIVPLEATDADAMGAWHAVYRAADSHRREHPTAWAIEELRAQLLAEAGGELARAWSGLVGDEVVTTGYLRAPVEDNTHLATVAVHTHPAHRNRGHGSAMLDHLVEEVGRLGRRTVLVEAPTPYDGPADGHGHPNADFLLHRGFTFALGDVVRILDLPADERLLGKLEAEAEPHHRGYAFRQFRGAVPEDIIVPFGQLVGALATEAPTGELELEPERFTPERIRADEKVFAASGRTKYTTVALAPDGAVVAYTELVVPTHDPGRLYQWGTLVAAAHRGHRLGTAVKARNLMWVQRECPDRTTLMTFNAEVNAHMVAVNEAMGFRPVERLGEYQRRLA